MSDIIRILQVVVALDGGGVERLLHDYLLPRKTNVLIDFAIFAQDEGILEKTFRDEGCGVNRVTPLRKNPFMTFKDLRRIITKGQYDIIHIHQGEKGIVPLLVSFFCRVPIRIVHSHSSNEPENLFQKVFRSILSTSTKLLSTNYFACGIDAGIWAFGRKYVQKNRVNIMTNAVKIEKFKFNPETRERLRPSFNIQDKIVIGNVASMNPQKNHDFLIRIFHELCKTNNQYVLFLVGRGALEANIRQQVDALHLNDRVYFLGVREDVHELLNMFDIFILPSLFEGLPVSLIEAQVSGLPILASSNITKELDVTGLIKYYDINKPEYEWVNQIKQVTFQSRLGYDEVMTKHRYNITDQHEWLYEFYLSCFERGEQNYNFEQKKKNKK